MDACAECGFEYRLDQATGAGAEIRAGAATIAALVRENAGDAGRRRAAPDTWSPLEYACHLRDMLLVQRERVLLARRKDRPDPEPMGRDERVEHDGYSEQSPGDVARQLEDAALLFAHVLDRLVPEDWERTMFYNYPTRQERSLSWVAEHTLHEVRHHLQDVRGQIT